MITFCSAEDQVSATVDVDTDAAVVRVHLDVSGGHTDAAARESVLAAVLTLPELAQCRHVQISLPLGDTELLEWVSRNFSHVTARAAGVSCLISARPTGADS